MNMMPTTVIPAVTRQGKMYGCIRKSSTAPKYRGKRSYGWERTPPMALPRMEPTVQVRPYSAKASVELVSSVMSPKAARTTATFPLSAPERQRTMIIIPKFVDRPLV